MVNMGTFELFTQLLLLFSVQFIFCAKKKNWLVKMNILRPSQFLYDFFLSKIFVKEFMMITIKKEGLIPLITKL